MSIASFMKTTWSPRVLSILRIVSAYLFILHGSSKILHIPYLAHFSHVQLFSLHGLAGILELLGGTLLVLGMFTRPVAFILSGEMAFAYFMGHAAKGHVLIPIMNGGDAAVLFCFIFLYFSFTGGGSWSVDKMIRNRG